MDKDRHALYNGPDTKRTCLIAKVALAAASKLFISSSLAFLGATTFATCQNDGDRRGCPNGSGGRLSWLHHAYGFDARANHGIERNL